MKYLALLLLLASCAPRQTTWPTSLINTAHLDHLYEEIETEGKKLGVIWIYCEAPDYRHVADEDEGFTCIDDVARALVFYCRHYRNAPSPELLVKIQHLTMFVLHMQAENGWFYNFMRPDGTINTTHPNSVAVPAFWTWRALWALSELNLLQETSITELQTLSAEAIERLLDKAKNLCATSGEYRYFDGIKTPACIAGLGGDQAGVLLMGLANHYEKAPSASLKELMLFFGDLLLETQHGSSTEAPYFAFLSWQNYWHAWGNSQAYALLRVGKRIGHQPFVSAAINEVKHFYPAYLKMGGINEIKATQQNDGAMTLDVKQFPQIAYGVRPMVLAALEAYAATGDESYIETAVNIAMWFFGKNPAGKDMYDPATGRTFDGIGSPEQVNLNSGAESTIEALLTLQSLEAVPQAKQLLTTRYRKY